VPHVRRASTRGDLHVFVNVVVPAKLSKRQRELLAEYAAETGEAVSPAGQGGIFDKVRDALG
jgi:molecular chaperone DnaJ